MSQPLSQEVLDQLFVTARTHNRFTGEVSDETLQRLYELVKMGPTAANSCPARFVFVKSPEAKQRASAVAEALQALQAERKIDLLGPSEAFLERAKGIYRWDLLIKSPDVRGLQRAVWLAKDACVRRKWPFLVDVDPYGVG